MRLLGMMRPTKSDVASGRRAYRRRTTGETRAAVRVEVEHDGQHGRAREAGLLQLAAVVLAVAQRQLRARREGLQLAPAVVAEPGQVAGGSPGRSGPA